MLLSQVLLTHIFRTKQHLVPVCFTWFDKGRRISIFPLSICNFSVAHLSCHWHLRSMPWFPGAANSSSRNPTWMLLPGKENWDGLLAWILTHPSFLVGTRIQEISSAAKWEENQHLIFTFLHVNLTENIVLSPVLFFMESFFFTFNFKKLLHPPHNFIKIPPVQFKSKIKLLEVTHIGRKEEITLLRVTYKGV